MRDAAEVLPADQHGPSNQDSALRRKDILEANHHLRPRRHARGQPRRLCKLRSTQLCEASARPALSALQWHRSSRRRQSAPSAALNATGGVPHNFSQLLAGFLELMKRMRSRLTRPYPDVPDVLSLLQADGWTLAICTNKPHAVTTRLLADLGIDRHFAAVLGGDSLPVGKPDPERCSSPARRRRGWAPLGHGRRRCQRPGCGPSGRNCNDPRRYGYGGGSVKELTAAAAIGLICAIA